MKTLQIVWLKVKLYGGYVLAVILAVFAIFLFLYDKNKAGNLLDAMQKQSEDYRKQIEELRKIKEEEARKHAEVETQYRATIAKIESDKQTATLALNNEMKKQIREIVEQTRGNPQAMSQRINDLFGIPIYSQENEQ
jgi:TolA-binding protein